MMKDFRALISAWPSLRSFAEDIGVAYVTAQLMKHRNSISPDYWPDVVACAARRGIRGVTIETLARMRAERRRPLARRKPRAEALPAA